MSRKANATDGNLEKEKNQSVAFRTQARKDRGGEQRDHIYPRRTVETWAIEIHITSNIVKNCLGALIF
jgi:hypothetical protein